MTNIAFLDLVILILATDLLLVSWFKGTIVAEFRATAEAWQSSSNPVKRFFGELLSCPKCLPVHIAFFLLLLYQVPHELQLILVGVWGIVASIATIVIRLAILALAIGGGASRLYNGFTHTHLPNTEGLSHEYTNRNRDSQK